MSDFSPSGSKLINSDIEKSIKKVQYHRFEDTNFTICCITLINNVSVIGMSSCIHKGDFDEEYGKKAAYDDAKRNIWESLAIIRINENSEIKFK